MKIGTKSSNGHNRVALIAALHYNPLMSIEAFGIKWPFTGRTAPNGAHLEVHNMHLKWLDLLWWNEARQQWIYLSTIPKESLTNEQAAAIISV